MVPHLSLNLIVFTAFFLFYNFQPVYVEKETEEDREGVRRIKSCPNLNEWPILVKREDLEDSSSEEDLTEEEMAANFKRIAMRRR